MKGLPVYNMKAKTIRQSISLFDLFWDLHIFKFIWVAGGSLGSSAD